MTGRPIRPRPESDEDGPDPSDLADAQSAGLRAYRHWNDIERREGESSARAMRSASPYHDVLDMERAVAFRVGWIVAEGRFDLAYRRRPCAVVRELVRGRVHVVFADGSREIVRRDALKGAPDAPRRAG